MKNLSFLAVAGLLIGSIASAVVMPPGYEFPFMGATLTASEGTRPAIGGVPTYLTLNRQDGAKEPSSFTMTLDTGIRCVMAPCPSSVDVAFKITAIHSSFHHGDTVRYEAVEVLKNIPFNVRIARRHLNVTESSMELVAPGGDGFTHRTVWEVELQSFASKPQMYVGNPEYLLHAQAE